MSFMLEWQPLGHRSQPLREPSVQVIELSEAVRFVVSVLSPDSLASPDNGVMLYQLRDNGLTLTHKFHYDFTPLHRSDTIVAGCLCWEYDFRESQSGGRDTQVLNAVVVAHARAYGQEFPTAFVGIKHQLRAR